VSHAKQPGREWQRKNDEPGVLVTRIVLYVDAWHDKAHSASIDTHTTQPCALPQPLAAREQNLAAVLDNDTTYAGLGAVDFVYVTKRPNNVAASPTLPPVDDSSVNMESTGKSNMWLCYACLSSEPPPPPGTFLSCNTKESRKKETGQRERRRWVI
jgi:hypothetical protein